MLRLIPRKVKWKKVQALQNQKYYINIPVSSWVIGEKELLNDNLILIQEPLKLFEFLFHSVLPLM